MVFEYRNLALDQGTISVASRGRLMFAFFSGNLTNYFNVISGEFRSNV